MIIETLVTTINADGSLNISPMGPTFSGNWDQFELRPFKTSTTLANLQRSGEGIVHITDDAQLIALAAIDRLDELPSLLSLDNGKVVAVPAISSACRWIEFRVDYIDLSQNRASINCHSVYEHRQRDFLGFNRAKHAVLEAAILATRIDFLPWDEIHTQYNHYRNIIDKTGGPQELEAFRFLEKFVFDHQPTSPSLKS